MMAMIVNVDENALFSLFWMIDNECDGILLSTDALLIGQSWFFWSNKEMERDSDQIKKGKGILIKKERERDSGETDYVRWKA